MIHKLFVISLLLHFLIAGISQNYADSLISVIETTDSDLTRFNGLLELTRMYLQNDVIESIKYGTQAAELAKEMNYPPYETRAFYFLGLARFFQGEYEKALNNWLDGEVAINEYIATVTDEALRKELLSQKSQIINNIGAAYKNMGEYDIAIEYYQRALEIQEEVGSDLQIARAYGNIANIHTFLGLNTDEAMVKYERSLEYFQRYLEDHPNSLDGLTGLAHTYENLGVLYRNLEDDVQAQSYYDQALNHYTDLKDKNGIARIQANLGFIYLDQENYQKALEVSQNALDLWKETGMQKEEVQALKDIGKVYFQWRRYEDALEYMNQSLLLGMKLQLKVEVYDLHKDISEIYKEIGDYRNSLAHYETYSALKDSMLREENLMRISELETKYETERVERDNEILKAQNDLQERDNEILKAQNDLQERDNVILKTQNDLQERDNVILKTQNDLQEKELQSQRILIYFIIGITAVILFFGIVVLRQFLAKKRVNAKLEVQNREISQQRDQIILQNRSIYESINYAQRIQRAVLPHQNYTGEVMPEHFILFKPKDIVSGDFYWIKEIKNYLIIIGADCTGHGVPGAFMSMLGIVLLNDLISVKTIRQPSVILGQLRIKVKELLGQAGKGDEQKDGMDMAIAIINKDNQELLFAGANNPLYLIRKNDHVFCKDLEKFAFVEDQDVKLFELKGDRQPIGIHWEEKDFTDHKIKLQQQDSLYIFSDGIVDQYGGENRKKYKPISFKKLLLSIHTEPLKEQKLLIEEAFETWKGNYEQIDDVSVIGVRI